MLFFPQWSCKRCQFAGKINEKVFDTIYEIVYDLIVQKIIHKKAGGWENVL